MQSEETDYALYAYGEKCLHYIQHIYLQ